MLFVYALILVHTAYCENTCTEDPIILDEIKDEAELIGNWSTLYHWSDSSDNSENSNLCPDINIEFLTSEDIDEMTSECPIDNLENVKLKMTMPMFESNVGLMKAEDKNVWTIVSCQSDKMEIEKVSDDFIKFTSKEDTMKSAMLGRKPLSPEELDCLVNRIQIEDNMAGFPCKS